MDRAATEHTRVTHASLAVARGGLPASQSALLDLQIALTAIPAPTGGEGARAAWVARRLRESGLTDVQLDAAGNVVGTRVGSSPDEAAVVVLAHLDTVFPVETTVEVRRDGTRVFAPGIGDNGRGLAAMIALAGAIDGRRVPVDRSITFVATVGEEGLGDLRGAKHFFAERVRLGERVASAIALDGPGDDRIVHQALGSRRYRITFRGPGGHSWAAFGAPNAVHAAAMAIATVGRIALPASPRTTLSVGRVGGGTSINAIPADAWFEVDARSVGLVELRRLDRELRAAVAAAVVEENGRRSPASAPLAAAVDLIGDRPVGEVDERHPLVTSACAVTRLVGREPSLAVASTDANVPIALGIPAVAIGAGGEGGDAHTLGEWYDDTDGARGLARALTLVTTAARLP